MKRFLLLLAVCVLILAGKTYATETQTRTWTDANGVTHIVTITRERAGDDSGQGTPANQGGQEQKPKEKAEPERPKTDKQEYQKTENDLPPGVKPNGSFQFDIDSHKPKF